MAAETLRAMALGGMRDHVGGGFHRYSVDAAWRVPHFEKMLYDQAQLVLAYLEAAQATGDAFFAAVAEDTLAYVARDLRDPRRRLLLGGRRRQPAAAPAGRCAQEGRRLLRLDATPKSARCSATTRTSSRQRFGIEPGGNAPQDPQGEFTGQNLLYTRAVDRRHRGALGQTARRRSWRRWAGRGRRCSMRGRTRPRPHLDDKVLTSWNGLMIAAFARAARVLVARPDAAGLARRRAAGGGFHPDTPLERFDRTPAAAISRRRRGDRRLRRRLCLPDLGTARALSGRRRFARGWPGRVELQARQDALFWDEVDGGWFSTTGTDPSVLLRLKEDYDGAEPSASSVSVLNALTLAHLTDDPEALTKAERTLARYGPRAGRAARVIPLMLAGLSTWYGGRDSDRRGRASRP